MLLRWYGAQILELSRHPVNVRARCSVRSPGGRRRREAGGRHHSGKTCAQVGFLYTVRQRRRSDDPPKNTREGSPPILRGEGRVQDVYEFRQSRSLLVDKIELGVATRYRGRILPDFLVDRCARTDEIAPQLAGDRPHVHSRPHLRKAAATGGTPKMSRKIGSSSAIEYPARDTPIHMFRPARISQTTTKEMSAMRGASVTLAEKSLPSSRKDASSRTPAIRNRSGRIEMLWWFRSGRSARQSYVVARGCARLLPGKSRSASLTG